MEGQWKGQLLWAGKAGVEIFDQEYAAGIDQVETGKRTSGKIRLALEVDEIKESLRKAIEYGATLVHEPVQTPWGDLNARIQSPDGMQITLFQSQKNLQSKKKFHQEQHIDLPFVVVSIISMVVIGFLYFKTKTKRLNAHQSFDSQGKKRTFIHQSNLSIGAALVILGIIMDIGNRSANYILIGIGVILAIFDANKILSK